MIDIEDSLVPEIATKVPLRINWHIPGWMALESSEETSFKSRSASQKTTSRKTMKNHSPMKELAIP